MKRLGVTLGVLGLACISSTVLGQDDSCSNGGQMYSNGAVVCISGFEQECVNGSWVSRHRFCSEDPQFNRVGEPKVGEPAVQEPGAPGEPAPEGEGGVVVPQVEQQPAAPTD